MRGSIQKRVDPNSGSVAYRVRVWQDDPMSGKQKQFSKTFSRKKEAEAELARWLADVERGTAVVPNKVTVAQLLDRWLADEAPQARRATTLSGYEITIRKHLKPALGTVLVQKLTVDRIETLYAEMRRKGLAPSTIRKCHLRLGAALDAAIRWGYVRHNVCRVAKSGKLTYKKPRIWTFEERDLFLEKAKVDSLWPLWLLALESGMRRGELLGLRWRDVNWERAAVHVQQEVVALKGTPIIQEPKTPESRRTVKLATAVMDELKRYKVTWNARKLASEEWEDNDLIFCTASGKPINPAHARRSFDRIVARAGVPDITIHGMRHCHAVWLLQAGVPVKVVSERLGHKDVTTTLNVYAAALPDMQDQAVDVLDRLMKRTG